MADFFAYSSTKPRTMGNVLMFTGLLFLALGGPLVVYGWSMPSTIENEMRPFIALLCGLTVGVTGLGMLAAGLRIRMRFPSA